VDDIGKFGHGASNVVKAVGAGFDGLIEGIEEGLGGQFLFAAEVAIKATFLKAGCVHHVLHGAAFKSAAIEDRGSEGNDPLPRQVTFFHRPPRPVISIPRKKTHRSLFL
jgi:hypothetical protein